MVNDLNRLNNKKEVHSQFENELFFKYLSYFSTYKIIYTNKLENDFFDEINKTLKIPKNPSFDEIKKIIKFLDTKIQYNLGITALERLTTKKGINLLSKLKLDNFENSILRESLYEEGKKYILDNMKAPNSNKLLKDILNLEKLSKTFKNLSLKEKKIKIIKILDILNDYPNFYLNNKDGGIPMKFIVTKKLYCTGFSYLSDIIFEKLKIKHLIGTGMTIRGKRPHSLSLIELNNKQFIFDPTKAFASLDKVEVKNNRLDFKNTKNKYYENYIFTFGTPETEILAQNMYNIYVNENNLVKQKKILQYGLKLSPNNILIKTKLKKIKK